MFPPTNDWTPFRPEEITDVDKVAKKRKYSPEELKRQVDKHCFRARVNLGLAFKRFQALKGEAGDEEEHCLLDR